MTDFQNYAGRYKFESIRLYRQTNFMDITGLMVETSIVSSIIDATTVCELYIVDARNILGEFPIRGGQRLELVMSYNGEPITRTFILTKIKNIDDHEGKRGYILEGISELAYVSQYRKISRHYEGTTSEIARAIFSEHTPEDAGIWDQSNQNQSLIIPNWSPLRTITWLAERSHTSLDDVKFRFFQDSKMNYHFAPIERFRDLYKQKPPFTYTLFKNVNRIHKNGVDIPNSQADVFSIKEIAYSDAFDINKSFKSGMLRGRNYNVDLTTKALHVVDYDYWEQFNENRYLQSKPMYERFDIFPGAIDMNYYHSQGVNVGDNIILDQSSIKKTSAEGYNQRIQIEVKGNHEVDIGQVINVEIPTPAPENTETKFDLTWTGKYYIAAKRDIFNDQDHRMILECIKESLVDGSKLG